MDVEVPRAAWAGVREPVDDPGRHRHGRPGPCAEGLRAVDELELAFEDVERVDVLLVEVRPGPLEFRADGNLVDGDLGQVELHDDPLVEPLAFAWPENDGVHEPTLTADIV